MKTTRLKSTELSTRHRNCLAQNIAALVAHHVRAGERVPKSVLALIPRP